MPAPDEIEVSIFGPGKGEAVAIHIGEGEWITVDSCRNQRTRAHPVLEYLDAIGVEVTNVVRLVVGTHSHDDHIAGIGELYRRAENALYITSDAMTSVEFFADVEADARAYSIIGRSVRDEFRQVHAEADARLKSNGIRPMKRAGEQVPLYSRPGSTAALRADVLALSPSSEAVERARRALGRSVGEEIRLSKTDPNECAVALWVTVGDTAVLLGADLPVGPKGCGWQAVCITHHPPLQASLFKIPHHGSPTGRSPETWDELVTEDAVALVAPFRAGATPRPQPDDIDWIAARADRIFQTAATQIPAAPRGIRDLQSDLRGVATHVWDEHGMPGHVRARRRPSDSSWRVELASPAFQVP